MENKNELSRRKFIANTAIGAIGTIGAAGLLTSCARAEKKSAEVKLPEMLDMAPDGKVLRAGLIGCGGRGTGAGSRTRRCFSG
jgi:myo-inositol 2-dehydrogenase/D-chiro-inositol 1-dehydrogenase